MNKVILHGNLGADPEMVAARSGTSILKLRLATSEVYFDKDKQKQERVEWHSVTCFGKRAEGLSRFLAKGMSVLVEGKLHTSSYEKNGEKRYRTEILADEIVVTTRKGDGGGRRSEMRHDADGVIEDDAVEPFDTHDASEIPF